MNEIKVTTLNTWYDLLNLILSAEFATLEWFAEKKKKKKKSGRNV